MSEKDIVDLLRYRSNLFGFPKDYFSTHSAEDLGISEEVREKLIAERAELGDGQGMNYEDLKKLEFREFEAEFFED